MQLMSELALSSVVGLIISAVIALATINVCVGYFIVTLFEPENIVADMLLPLALVVLIITGSVYMYYSSPPTNTTKEQAKKFPYAKFFRTLFIVLTIAGLLITCSELAQKNSKKYISSSNQQQ